MNNWKKSEWNPYSSKWKAAIKKKLDVKISRNENVESYLRLRILLKWQYD
ncbi:MAG: hypothetical protein ABIF88_00960 [archaeon]